MKRYALWFLGPQSTQNLVALEKLHRAFVLLGRFACIKRAEVFSLTSFGIYFSRVEPVLA